MNSLFDDETEDSSPSAASADAPLAARMRPRTLDEVVGQEHLLAPGKPLRAAVEGDFLSSALFWGPPGCGKSTLAFLIAQHTSAHFEPFSAVTGGVADVRKIIDATHQRRKMNGGRTLLFVDEIHRFNKAQQDAFLPHVENGTIVLVGATTENPSFSVNAPLLSRARVFAFGALSETDIENLLERALHDAERGLGERPLVLEEAAKQHLARTADGDARSALGALELASRLAPLEADGSRRITVEVAEEAVGRRAIGYDKDGDVHYDIISAFIKSVRGSDPDAAVYYLARMLEAGEDPRFIARRLVILASEDVGNADPSALSLAMAGFSAVQNIGMPECAINLAHVTTYLASAPKSNASYVALRRAQEDVRNQPFSGIPKPLRDGHSQTAKSLGHGKGYEYPHDSPGGFVEQQYLPEELPANGRRYYEPTENGVEAKIKARLERLWELDAESGD